MKRLAIGLVLVLGLAGVSAAADFAAVVDPYLKIQQALAGDKIDGVKQNAGAVATAAEQIGAPAQAIAAAAREVEKAGDIKAARNAFATLSDAVVAYADSTKAPLGTDVKVAYCDMKKKPWLQKGMAIRNPYYGSEMLECGVIKR